MCETLIPDAMAAEEHQNNHTYIRELTRPSFNALCNILASVAVERKYDWWGWHERLQSSQLSVRNVCMRRSRIGGAKAPLAPQFCCSCLAWYRWLQRGPQKNNKSIKIGGVGAFAG